MVKQRYPGVQLALVGSMAHDDPEGWDYYNRTVEHADGDPDIYILSNMNNVGAVEVNAFQVHSDALIQKSIKEGFGLTVTEALWKARPMVAGRVGGIVAQIERRRDGLARRAPSRLRGGCIEVLRDPAEARARALRGQGARAPALPDAAPAARLARALQPLAGNDTGGSADHGALNGVGSSVADRRLEPRPGLLRPRREGRARRAARRAAGS